MSSYRPRHRSFRGSYQCPLEERWGHKFVIVGNSWGNATLQPPKNRNPNRCLVFLKFDVWRGVWRCTHAKLAQLTPHALARDRHYGPASGQVFLKYDGYCKAFLFLIITHIFFSPSVDLPLLGPQSRPESAVLYSLIRELGK